jgi:hypothetical protein
MIEKDKKHLLIPLVECLNPVKCPILVPPPNTSMITINTFVYDNHITCHYIFSKNTHVHIQVFHILHNHTMRSL